MKNNVFKLKGENSRFPEKIKTWKVGDEVPEWISDIAKIGFIDGDGNITLSTNETNQGGLEILNSDGIGVLVRLESKKDFVCIALDKSFIKEKTIKNIFSLTEHQMELLYELVKE